MAAQFLGYNADFPRNHYDKLADKEWTRLTDSRRGELNYLVHMDVIREHVNADMDVLEIGAGAGIYTKELVHMARRLVVADLSEVQLILNQRHMRELGVLDLVDEYRVLDLADLGDLNDAEFDTVICIGGSLSYLLDQAKSGVQEALRVVKPGGLAIFGVMSLISTVIRFIHRAVKPRHSCRGYKVRDYVRCVTTCSLLLLKFKNKDGRASRFCQWRLASDWGVPQLLPVKLEAPSFSEGSKSRNSSRQSATRSASTICVGSSKQDYKIATTRLQMNTIAT